MQRPREATPVGRDSAAERLAPLRRRCRRSPRPARGRAALGPAPACATSCSARSSRWSWRRSRLALGIATFMLLARGSPVRRAAGDRRRHWCSPTCRCCCCSARCSPGGSPRSGSSAGAARPARGCMCGWSCCSASSRSRRRSSSPCSRPPSSISASRPGSTIRCATALNELLQASRGYLEEHQNNIRAGRARDGQRSRARRPRCCPPTRTRSPSSWPTQTALRGLTEAVIYEPVTGQVMASAGLFAGLGVEPPPAVGDRARPHRRCRRRAGRRTTRGCAPWCSSNSTPPLMLMIGRPIDPQILDHMVRTEKAVAEYERLDQNRSWLQIAFAWIFALVALLVLLGGGADRPRAWPTRSPARSAG